MLMAGDVCGPGSRVGDDEDDRVMAMAGGTSEVGGDGVEKASHEERWRRPGRSGTRMLDRRQPRRGRARPRWVVAEARWRGME